MSGLAARISFPVESSDTAVSVAAKSSRAIDRDAIPLQTEVISVPDTERVERPLVAALIAAEAEGVVVSPLTLHRAIRFAQTMPTDWPTPEIVVEATGDIAFDWLLDRRRVLSVAVGPTGSAGFSALVGYEPSYGRVLLGHGIPRTISGLMSRVRQPPTWTAP